MLKHGFGWKAALSMRLKTLQPLAVAGVTGCTPDAGNVTDHEISMLFCIQDEKKELKLSTMCNQRSNGT